MSPLTQIDQIPKFRIISDGTEINTSVFYGDTKIENLTNININIDADDGLVRATFTTVVPQLDLLLKLESVKIDYAPPN